MSSPWTDPVGDEYRCDTANSFKEISNLAAKHENAMLTRGLMLVVERMQIRLPSDRITISHRPECKSIMLDGKAVFDVTTSFKDGKVETKMESSKKVEF
jgi:hypothetical protein